MKYNNIREEALKNKVGADWFKAFDTTEILGNIDFTVFPSEDKGFGRTPLLWAEAKTGDFDLAAMFVQLILTIGKARTFDKTLPPAFLGAFDFKKIAFVPYASVQDIFYLNDFNWNVTPSNHETKEFQLIKTRIEATLLQDQYVYDYEQDQKELDAFIKINIAKASTTSRLKIDKNNFIPIYLRWLETVKPTIGVNWDDLKKANILDSDFYLADLFVDDRDTQQIGDDLTLRDNLFVVFQNEGYKIAKENLKQMFDATIPIQDKTAYQSFWKRYKRPPLKEFQDYIIERRDLLVPQDIRERKGAFFTPRKWVELSQKYITDYLGEDWQEEYYVWDCAGGTGNLVVGLTNRYHIYVSTLDQADVNVMHERIDQGANLLKSQVFQFDFLNDDFIPVSKGGKMPDALFEIINNEEKRKKLVMYINPPYAEAGNKYTISGTGEHKENTSNNNLTYFKYKKVIGKASNELFTQFLTRIYIEISNSKIGIFCKLKNLQSPNFKDFRNFFQTKLEKSFIVPADTFDNVKGIFPIGFFIYNLEIKDLFSQANTDIFNKTGEYIGLKKLYSPDNSRGFINNWIKKIDRTIVDTEIIGQIGVARNDMQNKSLCYISIKAGRGLNISKNTIIFDSIFLTVQSSINATWLNDRDPFFYPNEEWQNNLEFQNDCLTYALFDGQNRISSQDGINHWIPFTEREVNAQAKFESRFMTDFMQGKIKTEQEAGDLFGSDKKSLIPTQPLVFSDEARAVFDAGRALWTYYHAQKFAPQSPAQFPSSGGVTEGRGGNEGRGGKEGRTGYNPNASLYDIREHFQGRNEAGKMNNKSQDEQYNQLIASLRESLKTLAKKIEPKVYEYGFLKG
jgi:hypothetical protein